MNCMFTTSRMDIPSLSRIIHGFDKRINSHMHNMISKNFFSSNLDNTECSYDNLTVIMCNRLITIDMIKLNICEKHCVRLSIDWKLYNIYILIGQFK